MYKVRYQPITDLNKYIDGFQSYSHPMVKEAPSGREVLDILRIRLGALYVLNGTKLLFFHLRYCFAGTVPALFDFDGS